MAQLYEMVKNMLPHDVIHWTLGILAIAIITYTLWDA